MVWGKKKDTLTMQEVIYKICDEFDKIEIAFKNINERLDKIENGMAKKKRTKTKTKKHK